MTGERFGRLPIRHKLVAMIMLTATTVLVLASAAIPSAASASDELIEAAVQRSIRHKAPSVHGTHRHTRR